MIWLLMFILSIIFFKAGIQHQIIWELWIQLVRKMAIDRSITESNLQLLKNLINTWCYGHFINGIA